MLEHWLEYMLKVLHQSKTARNRRLTSQELWRDEYDIVFTRLHSLMVKQDPSTTYSSSSISLRVNCQPVPWRWCSGPIIIGHTSKTARILVMVGIKFKCLINGHLNFITSKSQILATRAFRHMSSTYLSSLSVRNLEDLSLSSKLLPMPSLPSI